MISCERCEELINARLDGYLTEEEAPLLEDHLAQCPDCRKLDRDLTTLHERLKNLSFDLPQDFAGSVMARLEAEAFQPVKKKKRPWAAAVCAAAAVLLAVAISPQVLPFGSSGADTAAGESAEAPEAMVMDSDVAPAEGGEAAPAPEESQAESENLKTESLTQEEAKERLEDYFAQRGLAFALTPAAPAQDGEHWLFQAKDPQTGETFRFSVSCTNGSVAETPLP